MQKKKTFILITIALLASTVYLFTLIAQADPVQDQKQNGDQVQLRECDPDNCACNDGSGMHQQKQQQLQKQNHHHDEEMPGQHHAHHWYWDGEN